MKRIISSLIIFAMLLGSVMFGKPDAVYAEENESVVVAKEIEFKGPSWGSRGKFTSLGEVKLDYHWLTTDCKYVYNPELASFASVLSTDIYENTECNIEGESEAGDKTKLLTEYGFLDVKTIDVPTRDVAEDKNDVTSIVIGHRIISIDEVKYDAYVVVIRGTDGSASEWNSNMDFGCDDALYLDKTGAHPDWTNKKNHKGFDVTANRVKASVDYYMESHEDADARRSVLFTGHSRGAAIANILGAVYEGSEISSCAYTFSTPNTTTDENHTRSSVFNIINDDDFVSALPLTDWGFFRYGTDIHYKLSANADIKKEAEQLMGDSYSCGDREVIISIFADIISTREEMYDWDGKANEYALPSSIETAKKVAEKYGLADYVSFEKIDGQNRIRICPAAVLVCVSNLIGLSAEENGSGLFLMMLQLAKLIPVEEVVGDFMESMKSVATNYSGNAMLPHIALSTYAITKYGSYEKPQNNGHVLVASKENGVTYYTCSSCGRYFSNADGTHEIEKDSWNKKELTPVEMTVEQIKSHLPQLLCGIVLGVVVIVASLLLVRRAKQKKKAKEE